MPGARTPAQQYNALMTYYLNLYKKRYGTTPVGWNRNRARYVFKDMLDDYGYDQSKEIIDYFFQCDVAGHAFSKLGFIYGDLYTNLLEEERDRQERIRLRRETEKRVNGN